LHNSHFSPLLKFYPKKDDKKMMALKSTVYPEKQMNQSILAFTQLSLKNLALRGLEQAFGVYIDSQESLLSNIYKPSLYFSNNKIGYLYVSGLALQHSKSHNLPPLEIAQAIASHLIANQNDFDVHIVPPGWIHLRLTDLTLSNWLQSIAVSPALSVSTATNASRLFPIQYAHARCCSLLRLAHLDGSVLSIEPLPDDNAVSWRVISPNPIPWLNSAQIRLTTTAESRLIAKLIPAVDDLTLVLDDSANFELAAREVSQAFQIFWSCCRIWGEVKINSLPLAQARLGLVLVTQIVLRSLLQREGAVAHEEL
jgi:arginyl-tRNA synthetase